MAATLKARIIKIGNSRGVRIPKIWLEQLHFQEEVELSVEPDRIVIRPAHHPRTGWDQQFSAMAAHGDDQLLDAPAPTEWEQNDWQW
jgi:antitoxin MazE